MTSKIETSFEKKIGEQEKRKLRSLHGHKRSVWFGLGMFGLVGWSVAIPTLLGTALGIWIDKRYPQSISWTLSFLIIGLCAGCMIAWHWIQKEDKEMHQDKTDNNE